MGIRPKKEFENWKQINSSRIYINKAKEQYMQIELKDIENKYEAEKLVNEVVKGQLAKSKLQVRFSVLLILIAIAITLLLIKSAKKSKVINKLKLYFLPKNRTGN